MITTSYLRAPRGSKGRRALRKLDEHAMHRAAMKVLDPVHTMKFWPKRLRNAVKPR